MPYVAKKGCPYRNNCKYYTNTGKCIDDRYNECQLVDFGLIEELMEKRWKL